MSGLVDRVVDHGLATRREDPADRRQVVVGADARRAPTFIDRFRELNARQMRELLAVLDDAELALSGTPSRRSSGPPSASPRGAPPPPSVPPRTHRKDPA